jgi:hypothetical protein
MTRDDPGVDRTIRASEGGSERRRLGHVAKPNPMRGIIDVAMVGLVGGGPRLALRAARVLLEDSYTFRSAARQARASEGK